MDRTERRTHVLYCPEARVSVPSLPKPKFEGDDLEIRISGIPVRGIEADPLTGCAHYRSALDIVAIKFECCQTYYSCFYCQQAEADHSAHIWRRARFDEKAVLCGACGAELAIRQYLECRAVCPICGSAFNPRCESHYPLYFETQR